MKKDNKSYDFTKKNRAGATASLRVLISLYLGYIAWNLIKTANDPGNTLPVWGAWLAAVFFAGVAVAFGFYTWKRYQRELSEAELSEDELSELEAADEVVPELSESDSSEDEEETP